MKRYIVEVEPGQNSENGRPSVSPVYRNAWVKDGFPELPQNMSTVWDCFSLSCTRNSSRRMIGHREIKNGKAGKYIWKTYGEVFIDVLNVGYGMRGCSVEPGARCGIYGINCPEWAITMEACSAHRIICVPIYDSVGENAVEYILRHAEISIVFVQDIKIPNVLKALKGYAGQIKALVSFSNWKPEQEEEAKQLRIATYSWNMFLKMGKENPIALSPPVPEDILTIMYTSGTLGEPKGVILTHETIARSIVGVEVVFKEVHEQMTEDDCYLSFLPLAHIFDRIIEEFFFHRGASVGYWQGDTNLLKDDLLELKPTLFAGVPRVFDRIYRDGIKRLNESNAITKLLFNSLYSYKFAWMKMGFKQNQASPIADAILFKMIKARLGGRVRLILSGAAPLSSTVEEFLRVTTCCHVLQGYGLTETCAFSSVAYPDDLSLLGTVGPVSPVSDIRLESVPEMGYDALAAMPQGEICFRGKTLFSGYYKRDDLTGEAFKDGWFHTGDIGELRPNGSIRIIDRKKNIFKLSQGEYIAAEKLESIYENNPFVESIWIYGNSFKPQLVAVVVANQVELELLAKKNGVHGDMAQICSDHQLKDILLQELNAFGKTRNLLGYERIGAIHIDPRPFDLERNLLTPTFKKKRIQMLKYYQEQINEMYSHLERE